MIFMNMRKAEVSHLKFTRLMILMMISLLPPFSLSNPRTSEAGLTCGPNRAATSNNTYYFMFVSAMEEIPNLVSRSKWGYYYSVNSSHIPFYALAQCYEDLSQNDCLLCYAAARTIIPRCLPSDSGRLYLDGCFLRYGSYDFARESIDQSTNTSICSNSTTWGSNVSVSAKFKKDAEELIDNLTRKAVLSRGFAVGSSETGSRYASQVWEGVFRVYGLAQCWQSLNSTGCGECLAKASREVKGCLPRDEGRGLNAGCYLRYSTEPFFNDPPQESQKSDSRKSSLSHKLMIAASVVGAIIILSTIALCYYRRRCFLLPRYRIKGQKDVQNIADFMRDWDSLAIKQYRYSEIKKLTSSFGENLGRGGYGSVYKGELPDGRPVAVKVLSETKGDGQDFINEVSSISRTSHVNIVTLLGFCYNRKRALIYEFMPNGSLDKYINRNGELNANIYLEWKRLYQIAVGIARGLDYLHRGCKTRIVHFDIKPHNILLDEDFCPKISDFGLAKLSERKESILSMLTARGTAGYIAPEVFFKHFGGVSHKSDVYSYGMMVLEMVGVRKNVVEVDRSSDVYFPQWIYEHLEHVKELNIQAVAGEEEEEISRKMMVIGLWCIQTNPSDRPSISKVVEMLEGSLQSLQIPPKPFLHSPEQLPQQSFTSYSES